MQLNKLKTQAFFSKSAAQYEAHACVQKDAAAVLLKSLANDHQCALDLGAGPFVNTFELKKHAKQVVSMDLSEAMLANKVSQAVCADMDAMPFQDNVFDLVFSNFAMQWSQDLTLLLSEVKRILCHGGKAHFSLVCDGSLREIKQAFSAVDGQNHVNQFVDFDALQQHILKSGLECVSSTHCEHKQYFETPLNAIKSIKHIGANNIQHGGRKGLLGKKAMQNLLNNYPQSQGKYAVTYVVAYLVLEKR